MKLDMNMTPEQKDFFIYLYKLGNEAVREAQEEAWRMNLPNVYGTATSFEPNAKRPLYYQYRDGSITLENPFR